MTEVGATLLAALIGALIGGLFSAISAYFSVRATLNGQGKIENGKRLEELAAVRLALHTEVGMIGLQCFYDYKDRSAALQASVLTNPCTAVLPPLTIYNAMAPNIGHLSREEIVALIGFAGTLADISVVARNLGEGEIPQRPEVLAHLLSNACGAAAKCLNVLPIPEANKDKPFIEALQKVFNEREPERAKARAAYGLQPPPTLATMHVSRD